jgi:hypothetical protein
VCVCVHKAAIIPKHYAMKVCKGLMHSHFSAGKEVSGSVSHWPSVPLVPVACKILNMVVRPRIPVPVSGIKLQPVP